MAKEARKTTSESELVQCKECKRWCYFDETEFSSLANAQKASFVCRLCAALNAAAQRMEGSIEGLQGELRAEREQRIELQNQLRASRKREEATASLLEQMKGDLQKERKGRTELEQRVKELLALSPGLRRCDTDGTGSGEGDRRERTGEKGGQGAAVSVSGHSMEASKTYSSVQWQSSSKAETQNKRQREKQV
ncbi:uncharacterized protein LOC142769326 [Rhipicephalus microplus]|uniref:uncharacterized protein LOC142769326 n=1 Tax=Rhipicephalus microplus TaxID=6941 RepID=UPI003F6BC8F4